MDHYIVACHKATAGEAPGPATIPNEFLKYLPVSDRDFIFKLFQIMAKYNYETNK